MSKSKDQTEITRRRFLRTSGAAAATVAGATVAGCATTQAQKQVAKQAEAPEAEAKTPEKPNIKRYRTLGRTGFKVSDISMGGSLSEGSVARYAYDRGINFFDTAEGYGDGDSERKIGQAMQYMDRSKIFIATKLSIKKEDIEQTVFDRYGKCLERMKTNYADALYVHAVDSVDQIKNPVFHAATKRLKSDGKLKHVGLSCHGPRNPNQDSMEKVLLAAVDDGRFDLMLMVYNFMKAEEGERVLRACKQKNIGTTTMKHGAGQLEIEPFDPDNPSEEYGKTLKRLMGRGMKPDEAVKRIQDYLARMEKEKEKNKPILEPFMAKYGIKTQDQLDTTCVQWALKSPDMHTVVVSMPDFDKIDLFVPLSGTELTAQGELFLREYQAAFGHQYCRHACVACVARCPHRLPVSTMMRYTYYFKHQRREKYAMHMYNELGGKDGSLCLDCSAPCRDACPHGVNIQASLIKAHQMLTFFA